MEPSASLTVVDVPISPLSRPTVLRPAPSGRFFFGPFRNVPEPARPDQLSRVLFLDRASRNPGPPQATTAPALTRSLQPPKNRPNPATSSLQTQNENC